jgi:hypothetical protein
VEGITSDELFSYSALLLLLLLLLLTLLHFFVTLFDALAIAVG